MHFNADYLTEEYALNTKWKDFPPDVQNQAIMSGIDLMSALILGSFGEQFAVGNKLASSLGLTGDIQIIGSANKYNLLGACIALGHSSNSFDIDDGHRLIRGHPGTSFVGGVLAAAIDKDVTYREYLTTLTICYELTIRWAMVMQDHYNFLHSTGTYGAFGTALGLGVLNGLDKHQLNNALSIADFHAPLTPVMRSVEFPSMNKDGVPFGALVGAMAYLETIYGTSGKKHLLELDEYQDTLNDLGRKYHIMDLYFKPYTCCRWAHQPILAIQNLIKQHNFSHKEVEQVRINSFESAVRLSKIKPNSTDEAQYNIAFPIASVLVHGDVGFQQVRDAALKDPDVLSMMDRLVFSIDPEMDKLFPAQRLAWVEITLKDGTILRSEVCSAPGEPEDPNLNLDWITNKFKRITADMLDSDIQEQMIDLMRNRLDTPVQELVKLINVNLKL